MTLREDKRRWTSDLLLDCLSKETIGINNQRVRELVVGGATTQSTVWFGGVGCDLQARVTRSLRNYRKTIILSIVNQTEDFRILHNSVESSDPR